MSINYRPSAGESSYSSNSQESPCMNHQTSRLGHCSKKITKTLRSLASNASASNCRTRSNFRTSWCERPVTCLPFQTERPAEENEWTLRSMPLLNQSGIGMDLGYNLQGNRLTASGAQCLAFFRYCRLPSSCTVAQSISFDQLRKH